MSVDEGIRVEQAVHGYAHGHQLLAHSVALPSSTWQTVLTLSDSAGDGSSVVPEYLTAYPLPSSAHFALARTWPATEQKRPGCVWTHTLFVKFTDLAHMSDLSALVTLFRRPLLRDSEDQWLEYSKPLTFHRNALVTQELATLEAAAIGLIGTIYGQPGLSVRVVGIPPDRAEELMIRIWSQQWPGLRRNFSFCTWSAKERTIDRRPFDVLIGPPGLVGTAGRSDPRGTVIWSKSASANTDFWVKPIVEDIGSAGGTELRGFLWKYGVDATVPRAAFSALARVHLHLVDDRAGLRNLMHTLAENFPAAEEMRRLKVESLSAALSRSETSSVSEMLEELLDPGMCAAIPWRELVSATLLESFWSTQSVRATAIADRALSSEQSAFRDHYLKFGAKWLVGGGDHVLSSLTDRLVEYALEAAPALAGRPAIWSVSPSLQRDRFNVIRRIQLSPDLRFAVVLAIILGGADSIADQVVDAWGKGAIGDIISALADSDRFDPESTWAASLRRAEGDVDSWVESKSVYSSKEARVVLSVLNPLSSAAHRRSAALISVVRSVISVYVKSDSYVAAFLMTTALASESGGIEQIKGAFETVHSRLAVSAFPDLCWRRLQPQLPPARLWKKWDNCERLRRAVVERAIEESWKSGDFLGLSDNHETFEYLARLCDDTKKGRRFLRKVQEDIDNGEVRASPAQVTVLRTVVD